MSAKRVTNVVLTVNEETARLIKSLLYRANWSDFPGAREAADYLEELEIDSVDLSYNRDTEELDAA